VIPAGETAGTCGIAGGGATCASAGQQCGRQADCCAWTQCTNAGTFTICDGTGPCACSYIISG
jgi:hypothetical protein